MWVRKTVSACHICTEPSTSKRFYMQKVFCDIEREYLCHWCYKTLSIHFRSSLCIERAIYNGWSLDNDGVYVHIHDYMNIRNANPCIQDIDKTVRPLFFKYRNDMITRAQNMNLYRERINELVLENSRFNVLPNDMINVINDYLISLYQL